MAAIAGVPAPESGVRDQAQSPIDHVHLARYTLGNRALEIEVLQLFAEQTPDYLEALRSAGSEKAWRDAAHTIKGSARAVGAMRVAERAELAEALQSSPDVEARARAVAALEGALAEARLHIETLKHPD